MNVLHFQLHRYFEKKKFDLACFHLLDVLELVALIFLFFIANLTFKTVLRIYINKNWSNKTELAVDTNDIGRNLRILIKVDQNVNCCCCSSLQRILPLIVSYCFFQILLIKGLE